MPARNTPTTPVLPMPRCTSMPPPFELARDGFCGAVFLQTQFGMGVDVVAECRELVLVTAYGVDGRKGHQSSAG